ncbi:hypothetical protein ES705_33846 [subsurface metagenome]
MEERKISIDYIHSCIENHDYKFIVKNDELHFYKHFGDWVLKVVFNPSNNKVITAYYDRSFRRRIKDESNL